jgi:lipopolysaccharide transport system permease protein
VAGRSLIATGNWLPQILDSNRRLENRMADTDIDDHLIKEGSVPSVRTVTALGDIVDHSVHTVAAPRLSDLWRNLALLPDFMPLFKVLVWRSISLRYTQSFLGIFWVIAQPIASTFVVFFMFTLIRVNTADGSHQGIFLFSGILAWQFFARGLNDSTGSLLTHSGILTRIYLPKIMLPLASIVATWFDTLVLIVTLILTCALFGITPTPRLLWLPVFLTLISLASLSVGLGLAPLNALYRDVGLLVPFGLQFGMYATPVYYATRFIPEKYQLLYHLNPMVSLVEGVRWSILPESPAPDLGYLLMNVATILVAMAVSLFIYQKLESVVIDRI